MTSEELFMQRALELARLGAGRVSPNPLVGCVVVHEGQIIGEGWHQRYGEPHAEVNAIHSVADKSVLSHAQLYVNLEPCSHTGKTPPCADLLVMHKVKKVYVAHADPNPLVAGKGIEKLQQGAAEVVCGVLEGEAKKLNRRFLTYMTEQRPYVMLKWAQTGDGFIARENFDSKWISNTRARQLVHRWRGEEDAILVGYHTAVHDNPKLTVRDWTGTNPIRIVIDRELSLPGDLHLFDQSVPTICYNLRKEEQSGIVTYARYDEGNMAASILADLYKRKIQSVMIEGGAQTIKAFVDADLWDEARVFKATKLFGAGIQAPAVNGQPTSKEAIHDDELLFYFRG